MTASDESPPHEVRSVKEKESLLGPKAKIRMGAWNVRTMYETSKTAQIIREVKRYGLDILGMIECRWTGSGRQVTNDGSVILYSGHRDAHIRGVALIVSKKKPISDQWEPISDRMIRARFNSKYYKLSLTVLCTN